MRRAQTVLTCENISLEQNEVALTMRAAAFLSQIWVIQTKLVKIFQLLLFAR